VKLAMTVRYDGEPRRAAADVVALERAGLDVVWVPEAYGFDAPTLMGYLAALTETVQIGSGIVNVFSRTPAALLQTAAGLDHLSGGRAILGLGASGPQVVEGFHGVPYDRPLTRTREVIEIVRQGLRREPLEHHGKVFTLPLPADQGLGLGKPLKLITHPERADLPIYVASLGERNVAMTAELADGWMPIFYWPEKARDVWGAALDRGLAKRSPDLGPMETVASAMVAIGDDVKDLLDLARPTLALYVGGMGARGKNFYNDLACSYGFEQEAREIQELYLAGRKDEAAARIPVELLEATNLVGPAAYVRERLAAMADSGVTTLTLTPVGGDPARTIGQLKEWVS